MTVVTLMPIGTCLKIIFFFQDDFDNFKETLLTSEECVEKLKTFLSTNNDSANDDSAKLIRSWLELSLQAQDKFSGFYLFKITFLSFSFGF